MVVVVARDLLHLPQLCLYVRHAEKDKSRIGAVESGILKVD
jgi:hypothetical protein